MKSVLRQAYRKASVQLGIPEKTIELIYRSYWGFIKNHLRELNLQSMTKDDFKTIPTNFNIPYIGKLYTNYEKKLSIKRKLEHVRVKENQANVQPGSCD